MFEQNSIKEKLCWKALWTIYKWGQDSNGEIMQFLQNGGDIKQAIGMFEFSSKIVTIEDYGGRHF